MRWHYEDEKPKAGRPFVALMDDGSGADTYMLFEDGSAIDVYLPAGHRFYGRDQVPSNLSRPQRDKGAE